MNTPQYTPPPWELFEHSWSDASIYGGPDNSKLICRMSIHDEATEETQAALETEMSANGHLMEAAPELFEALKRCDPGDDYEIDPLAHNGNIFCELTVGDMRAVRAALRKALGQSA